MNRSFSAVAFTIALLLHAGLIAWVVIGLPAQVRNPPEPVSIAVQLLPLQETEVPPVLPPSSPPPSPPKKIPAIPKSVPKPKTAAKPPVSRTRRAPQIEAPTTTPAPAPSVPSAKPLPAARPPAAQVETPSAPPAPAKTSVYVSAEYAASNPKPVYPAMSRRYGEEGTVILRVLVKADGTAGQVEIRSSSGYPLLDKSARAAVQGWRFHPATTDGKPVADWFLISIPFKLRN